jgi:hypothetical protein
MLVFEWIGMAWHAGMRYPAHWHAVPSSAKTKKIWSGIILKPRAGKLRTGRWRICLHAATCVHRTQAGACSSYACISDVEKGCTYGCERLVAACIWVREACIWVLPSPPFRTFETVPSRLRRMLLWSDDAPSPPSNVRETHTCP